MKGWILFLICVIVISCQEKKKASVDINSSIGNIEYAQHFKLIDRSSFVELQIINPETREIERKFGLVKRSDKVRIPSDLELIEVPIQSIVTLSGTQIGMMEKLQLASKIVGVSDGKFIANPTVLQRIKSKKTIELGEFSNLNPERIFQTKSKIVFHTGFDGNTLASESKLAKLGITCIPNYDWKENHPLGKAEWIKVLGYLFDKTDRANNYFEQVKNAYNALVQKANKLEDHPTVFSGMMYGDIWYMPAGESFGAQLLQDAGADYCAKLKKGTGSVMFGFEEVLKQNQQTSIWVNVEVSSKKELIQANPKYRFFEAFQTGRMYSYAHRLNYFWENSAIEPHFVLSDLIQILHSSNSEPTDLYFYRKLTE